MSNLVWMTPFIPPLILCCSFKEKTCFFFFFSQQNRHTVFTQPHIEYAQHAPIESKIWHLTNDVITYFDIFSTLHYIITQHLELSKSVFSQNDYSWQSHGEPMSCSDLYEVRPFTQRDESQGVWTSDLFGGLNTFEKYEFVNWDDEIPNWMEKYQISQTTNQLCICPILHHSPYRELRVNFSSGCILVVISSAAPRTARTSLDWLKRKSTGNHGFLPSNIGFSMVFL